MKVLHSAFMVNPAPGIMNQMQWERMAAAERGLDWDARLFCRYAGTSPGELIVPAPMPAAGAGGQPGRAPGRLRLRRDYFQWLKQQAPRYDVILLRYGVSDPMQTAFVRGAGRPVYLVHHTLEVPELRHSYKAPGRLLRVGLETFFGKLTLKSSNGIVAVTDEILRYEKNRAGIRRQPGYVYPNGIYYPEEGAGYGRDARGGVPEILFIASYFARWHGLDLLLDSVARSGSDFILHLVGTLSPEDRAKAVRDERIRLHGVLSNPRIEELSDRCWIGLSSFALGRKGMEQACTLKVREYLLNGLPVYANYLDVFPDGFEYYRMGPPDIERILEYARSIRSAARAEVAEAARPFISKTALLAGLHDWLEKRVNGGDSEAA